MSEEERKRRYEAAKARRRARWAEMQAKRPPGEFSAYGIASIVGMAGFGAWWLTTHAQIATIGFCCSLLVFAAVVAAHWRWEDGR